jgi:hypothetical protein
VLGLELPHGSDVRLDGRIDRRETGLSPAAVGRRYARPIGSSSTVNEKLRGV